MKKLTNIIFLLCLPSLSYGIIGGTKVREFDDLVRLDFKNGTMCSGTFIDPYTILTAAHCLMDDQKLVQVSSGDKILSIFQVKNILHPEFTHSFWPDRDIGLIKTTKNENFKGNFKVSNESVPLAGSATIFGCGITHFYPKSRDCASGKNSYVRIGSVLFFIGDPSISPNDSGGSIVDELSGQIIALPSQTTVNTDHHFLPTLSVATTLSNDFIIKNLGELR